MENKVTRFFTADLETREEEREETKVMVVEGYAIKFDEKTQIGKDKEQIDKNALKNTEMSDVVMTYNHDFSVVLARTTSDENQLSLTVDDVGLKIRAEIVDTQTGKDVYQLIKRGLISQMSFAATFGAVETIQNEETGENLYLIKDIKRMYDVSAVTYPAYKTTEIAARSFFYEQNTNPTNGELIGRLKKLGKRL